MRPLLPTWRERKRYLVYEVITASATPRDLSDPLLERLGELLGVLGAARAGLLSVQYDPRTQTGILRTAHTAVADVRACLVTITHLGRQEVLIRTLGISGALTGARRFLPKGTELTAIIKTKGLHGTQGGNDDASDATPDDGV